MRRSPANISFSQSHIWWHNQLKAMSYTPLTVLPPLDQDCVTVYLYPCMYSVTRPPPLSTVLFVLRLTTPSPTVTWWCNYAEESVIIYLSIFACKVKIWCNHDHEIVGIIYFNWTLSWVFICLLFFYIFFPASTLHVKLGHISWNWNKQYKPMLVYHEYGTIKSATHFHDMYTYSIYLLQENIFKQHLSCQ